CCCPLRSGHDTSTTIVGAAEPLMRVLLINRRTTDLLGLAFDGLHSRETVTCPVPSRPIARAAAGDRSISLPRTQGPRSLMRTVTHRPRQTRTRAPNGNRR